MSASGDARLSIVGETSPREEWSVASGHRGRNRLPRAHARRLPGGSRARGAGDRRRRGEDREGRERRGPVFRTRPGAAAAEEPRRRPAPLHHVVRRGRGLRRGPLPVRRHPRGRFGPRGPRLRPGGSRRASLPPGLGVPDRGQVDRPGGDGAAGDEPGQGHRSGRPAGRPGLEPGVPEGGIRGTGQPDSGPHRAGGHVRPGRGAAPRGVRDAAGGRRPAARDGSGDGRTGQGGGERVPGHQDLLHQRHGRGLRGGRRRRDTARRGAWIRRADRKAVPVARPRLRWRLPAQGRPRVPGHRIRPGRGLGRQPAHQRGRHQRGTAGTGRRAGSPSCGRHPGWQASGRARRGVQAQQRRRPRLTQPGGLRAADGRGGAGVGPRPGGDAQRRQEAA